MLTVEEARAKLAELDWPGALAQPTEGLVAERVWVPFSKASGQLEAKRLGTRLTLLRRPTGVAPGRFQEVPPAGERVLGAPSADATLVPFWIFKPHGSFDADAPFEPGTVRDYWAAVDATAGQLVSGQLEAAPGAARARLWFFLGLLLLSLSLGSSIVIFVLRFPLFFVRGGLELYAWDLVLVSLLALGIVLGYLGYKVRGLVGPALATLLGVGLPGALIEPVSRLGRGVIEFPHDRRWLGLLRWTGGLILVCCFGQVAWVFGRAPYDSALATLFGVIGLVLGISGGVLALLVGRGNREEAAPPPAFAEHDADPAVVETVRVAVRIGLLTCVGFVLGAAFSASGLGMFLFASETTKDSVLMMEWGARAGALVGAALAPASPGARVTLSLGTVLEVLGYALLNGWFAPLAVFVAMLAAAIPMVRELDVERPQRAAALAAWGFSLGAALGRVGGKALGLILLGPVGIIVGEALGEHVGSALGLGYAKRVAVEGENAAG